MRNKKEAMDYAEFDAIDGILLLKKEQRIKKVLLARFYENNNKESEVFDIYEKKFRIIEGESLGLFFYFYLEKTWFLFIERGSIRINGKKIVNSGVLRNETLIEIGSLRLYFEIKHIVRKEYKKLLVEVILDSPRKKLLLSEIYEKLLESYGFGQKKKRSWINSIRCVLSKSKVFYKVAKEIKYGRGCFWCVNKEELEIMDRETLKKSEKKTI